MFVNLEQLGADMRCQREGYIRRTGPHATPDTAEELTPALAADLLEATAGVAVAADAVNNFLLTRKWRENEIQLALDMLAGTTDLESRVNVLNVAFPRNFTACRVGTEDACQYAKECLGYAE